MSRAFRAVLVVVTATLLAVTTVVFPWSPPQARAAAGDYGFQDQSFSGAVNAPTADKPQSKLWYAGGFWWADMFDTVSKTWHIFKLNRSTQKWTDTGTAIDDRINTSADSLWDGSHLYVASHVVTTSSATSPTASKTNSPARLYRYNYVSATQTWTLDTGFPATINNNSSESLTLDKDSTGKLWVTWTQVSGNSSAGFTSAVYVNTTTTADNVWGTPLVLPLSGANPSPDDISALAAFGQNKIGVVWSNQLDGAVHWAVHVDGNPAASWNGGKVVSGSKIPDDHVNLKSVQSDAEGRLYAVVKTSLDSSPSATPESPQINLLVFRPSTGVWTISTFGTLADCHTRPLLMIDDQRSLLHVFATGPSGATCGFTGEPGTIYEKTASMNNPVFAPGRGTPVIRDASSANMNDSTSSKQSVNDASGLIVMASNAATKRYWHADLPLVVPAPVASFTASPTTGTAPLPVQFTDTSTNTPTSWAWDFGDGSTATTQNPAHTYTTAGTYTVTLTATNTAGSSTPSTSTITVNPAENGSPTVTAGQSTTAVSTTTTNTVTLTKPDGVVAGDLLIAQINADLTPAMSIVPPGWTAMLAAPLKPGSGASVYVYYHAVTTPATEPASWTWQLSSAQKWGAGITGFHGVDTTNPFDSALTTIVSTSTKLKVPSVTTVTAGALVVGGVGVNTTTAALTAPTGWTKPWESAGGQDTALGYFTPTAPGPTGVITWTLNSTNAAGGWMRALKPGVSA